MKNQKISFIGIFILMFLLGSCKVCRNPENINPKVPKETQAGPFKKSE